MKTTPITQTAKSTPFKIADSLVTGAEKMYSTQKTGFEGGKAVKGALPKANNQASDTVPGSDGTIVDDDLEISPEDQEKIKKEKEKSKQMDALANSVSTIGKISGFGYK